MRPLCFALSLIFAASLLPVDSAMAAARPKATVRVPQDAKTLTDAIKKVGAGGIIELARGTYPSPGKGFAITGPLARKSFTVRGAVGAEVVLDGGGTRPVLSLIGPPGKRVVFERIVFRNGRSTSNNAAGGVTVSGATATFRLCTFQGNREEARATGGGGVKVFNGASVAFINSRWVGNSSDLRGGGLVVRDSTVTIQGGAFLGNRTNLPGHQRNAAGGGIAVLNGVLRVTGTRFEGNQAGWTGGGIYAIGGWDRPGSDIRVTDSTFVDNVAEGNACCANPDVTTGGAIQVEDQATLAVNGSLFLRNRADVGGAIDTYRAVVNVDRSVFRGNQTTRSRPERGAGGAIAVVSADFADSSTNNGAANRRSAQLTMSRSLLQGGGEVERAPYAGGCLFASGDSNRQYGQGGVGASGSLGDNRARVHLTQVAFFDCDVETTPDDDAFGGAILLDLASLTMIDSMILASDARGNGAGAGAVMVRQESNAAFLRTSFAGNSAERWGGALFVRGSNLEVTDSRFYGNAVSPGFSESIGDSRGAALFTIPFTSAARPRKVTGFVTGSVFSENVGIHVWDVEPSEGPANEMRYGNNRFTSTPFGAKVYFFSRQPGGFSVPELNVTSRVAGAPNTLVANLREGALLGVPSADAVGAGAPAPTETALAYAWTGRGASLAGTGLPGRGGLLEVPPGSYALVVDGASIASLAVPIPSTSKRSDLASSPPPNPVSEPSDPMTR
jgi:hypothetical protein